MVQTALNDTLLNAFNPMQLSAWRANMDMQYIVFIDKFIKYVAKYATQCDVAPSLCKICTAPS